MKAMGLLPGVNEYKDKRTVTQYVFLPLVGLRDEESVHDILLAYLENRWDRHTFSARCEMAKAVS